MKNNGANEKKNIAKFFEYAYKSGQYEFHMNF